MEQTSPASDAGHRPVQAPVLEARGLSKSYSGTLASRDINLKIFSGEILAIVGDNGAGKSTLVKMLCGAHAPDAGELLLEGSPVSFSDPHDARQRGVETVYQGLALSSVLDVAGNLYLGREEVRRIPFLPRSLGILKRKAMAKEAAERMADLKIHLPGVAGRHVDLLSGGQRQSVAITRAAIWANKVVFMDEPTAALGVTQSRAVMELAQRLAQRGLAVVIITHTLPFVMEYADRVAVLRRGEIVADIPVSETNPEHLVSLIVGFQERVSAVIEASDSTVAA